MDVNKLMSYIDNLTPQQAGGYLSGQTPFPYSDMPRELWAPRMAAAAHQKLAAGGLVNRMDDKMTNLLAHRYFGGGQVQRFAAGGAPEEPQVYSLDAEGRSLGKRKASAAPIPGEVSVEPVPTTATPRTTAKLGVFDKEGKLIGRRFSSEPLLKNEQFIEPLTAGLAVPSVGTELGRAYDSGVDLITAVPRAIADMGGAVAQNYRRQQALREGGKNQFTQSNAQDILNSIAQDEAGLKEAIAKGGIPQQPQEQKDANAKFMAEQGPANAAAAAGVRGVAGMPEITIPKQADSSAYQKSLEKIQGPKTVEKNVTGIKSVMPADRYEDRMKRLEDARKGLEPDRQRDMWLGILQGAGAGLASGNRSFLGSLGTTASEGAKNVAASEKDYRTRKAGLEEKQMKIEDASDAITRDVANKAIDMTDKQTKDYYAAQAAIYGLSKDQFEQAYKLAELKLKQFTAESEANLRVSQGKYYESGGRGAAGNAFTAEDKTKMILAQKKVIMEKNPGISDARAQEMAKVSVEQSIAEAMSMSGQGGGTDLVDTLPKGATTRR